jgi:hypothetical protein
LKLEAANDEIINVVIYLHFGYLPDRCGDPHSFEIAFNSTIEDSATNYNIRWPYS